MTAVAKEHTFFTQVKDYQNHLGTGHNKLAKHGP